MNPSTQRSLFTRIAALVAVAATFASLAFAQAPKTENGELPDLAAHCPPDTFMYLGFSDWPGLLEACEDTPLQPMIEKGSMMKLLSEVMPDMMLPGYLGSGAEDMEEEEIELSKERFKTFREAMKGPVALIVSDPTEMLDMLAETVTGGGFDIDEFELDDDLLDPEAAPDEDDLEGLAEFEFQDDPEEMVELKKRFALVMHVGDEQKAMQKMLKDFVEDPGKLNVEGKMLKRKDGGVPYFVSEQTLKGKTIEDIRWTFVDGTMVLAMSDEALLGQARDLRKPPKKSLADTEGFARMLAEAEAGADGVLYLNLKEVAAYADEQIREMDMEEAAGAPFAMDPELIAKALELDAMESIHLSFKVHDDGVHMNFGFAFTEETKLQGLLLPYLEKAPLQPDFIPRDVDSVSSMRVSPLKWHDDFIALLSDMNPQVGVMLGMGTMMMKQELGVDYKKDLLGNFGDSVVYSQSLDMEKLEEVDEDNPLAGQDMIIGIGTKDEDALHGAIKTMMAAVGGGDEGVLEEEKFLGQTMYMIEPAADADLAIGFTYLDDHMVWGVGEDSLKSAIRTFKNPRKSVWKSEAAEEALAQLPPDAITLAHSRNGGLFGQMGIMLEQMEVAGFEEEFDVDLEDLEKVFGTVVSAGYKDGPRFISKAIMLWADE